MNTLKNAIPLVATVLAAVFLANLAATGQPKSPPKAALPRDKKTLTWEEYQRERDKGSIPGARLKALLAIANDSRYKKWIREDIGQYNVLFGENKTLYYVAFNIIAPSYGGESTFFVRKKDLRVIRRVDTQ